MNRKEKNNKNIITKGDTNNAEDKPINQTAIKGKLVYTIKNANKKLDILKIAVYAFIVIAITENNKTTSEEYWCVTFNNRTLELIENC